VAHQLHWPAIEQATLLYDVSNDHKKEELTSNFHPLTSLHLDEPFITYHGPSKMFQLLSIKPFLPSQSSHHQPVVMNAKFVETANLFNELHKKKLKLKSLMMSAADDDDDRGDRGDGTNGEGGNVGGSAVASFIFNPFSKAVKETTMCVCGEELTFHVRLINAFKVPLQLQSLQLKTSGLDYQQVSHELCSTKIPPLAFKPRFKPSNQEKGKFKNKNNSRNNNKTSGGGGTGTSSSNSGSFVVSPSQSNESVKFASVDNYANLAPIESIVRMSITPMAEGSANCLSFSFFQ
jgi:hypothetical protein